MTETPQTNAEWSECPKGELSVAVDRLKSQRRRRTYQRAIAATSAICVLAFVGSVFLFGFLRGHADISCARVQELAPSFIARTTDAETTKAIRAHLGGCDHCRDHFQATYPKYTLPVRSANATDCPSAPEIVAVTIQP